MTITPQAAALPFASTTAWAALATCTGGLEAKTIVGVVQLSRRARSARCAVSLKLVNLLKVLPWECVI